MKKLCHIFAIIAAGLLLASCGSSVEFTPGSAPSGSYSVVAVKNFDYKDEDGNDSGKSLTREFTTVLAEELQATGRFNKVATQSVGGRAIRVEGEVTYLAEGNTAMRIGVGMGTGKAHFFCTARFYDNASGSLLGTLLVEKSSKQGVMGLADNFPLIRRAAAVEIAAKAAELAGGAP